MTNIFKWFVFAFSTLATAGKCLCVSGPVGFYSSERFSGLLQRPTKANATALNKMLKTTPTYTYNPNAKQSLYFELYSNGPDHQAWISDIEQTFKQALAFACTGRAVHAQNAVSVLRAWARTNTHFGGPNSLLEAAWGTASMAKAVAILLNTPESQWTTNDTSSFMRWVNKENEGVAWIVKNNKWAYSWDKQGLNVNNWQASILDARLSLAFLEQMNDMRSPEVTWSINQFKHIVTVFVAPNGKPMEITRDLIHTQFGIGGLMQVAEALRVRGLDLFNYPGDGRLARMMEGCALALNGGQPFNMTRDELNDTNWVIPTGWWIAFNNFHVRMGLPMLEVRKLLQKPIFDAYVFHWGMDDV